VVGEKAGPGRCVLSNSVRIHTPILCVGNHA
jgi:hypothetical protein